MSCTSPMTVYQDRVNRGPVSFFERPGYDQFEIGCGRCMGCRLGRAQAWSLRCQHEAQLHDENSFVTLTYDDSHIPVGGSLRYSDVQAFLRKLRRDIAPVRLRFFCAGEYGSQTLRPHYHLLLFGVGFARARDWSEREHFSFLPESGQLKELWKHGSHHVGFCTPASAAYVARYALKKVYGRRAGEDFYDSAVDQRTGEVNSRVPEFIRMSLRPAIGREWYEKYGRDVLPGDSVVHENWEYRVPRYYEKLFRERDAIGFEAVENARAVRLGHPMLKAERAPGRRAVREEILRARVSSMDERRVI